MTFNIQDILAAATGEIDATESARVADAVAERLSKLQTELSKREAEAAKYTKKLVAFNEEIATATTPAEALKIVAKKAYTVRVLHLED